LYFSRPNTESTIEERTAVAVRQLDASLRFLAGALTMFPFLQVQRPMLKSDAKKLFVNGRRMILKPKHSA
jgi:hypothetical protein